MLSRLFLIIVLSLSVNITYAAYTCAGKIEHINQAYEGSISIISTQAFGNTLGRTICNLNAEWKGISTEVCKGWLSKALSIQAQQKTLVIQYTDAFNCSSQPTWGTASSPHALY